MISQAEQMQGRVVTLATVAPTQGNAPQSSEPQITLTPRTSCGLRTTSFMFCGLTDNYPQDGIEIVIWKRHAATGRWARLLTISDYLGEWCNVCDLNASQLWFQLTTQGVEGDVRIAVEELGISP